MAVVCFGVLLLFLLFWGVFLFVCFCCCFVLLLLFSFSLLCFYTALLFVVLFFTPNRFRFPNLDKTTAEYRRNSNPTPAEVNGGTIPTTTQNVPNKLYIRTSTFRFSSQLPGSPTVAAVGLSGYISMLQWTSQGPRTYQTPLPALLSVTTNSLWRTINFSAHVAVFTPVLE